jgi:hypothetical protein
LTSAASAKVAGNTTGGTGISSESGSGNFSAGSATVEKLDGATFLRRPPAEQGADLGTMRRQMMSPGEITEESYRSFLQRRLLAEEIRGQLEALETQPKNFAEFQSAFIQSAIGLDDSSKVGRIREILEATYTEAVAQKLDGPSRPAEDVQAWGERRDILDRRATHEVQALFTSEERGRFDRAFLGVMGIDLGINDGGAHRFVKEDGTVVFPSESAGQ